MPQANDTAASPPLTVQVEDAAMVGESTRVFISPILLMGIASSLPLATSVAPELPHYQPTHQPLEGLEALTFAAVVVMLAIAGVIRRMIQNAHSETE
jgi:hypothetical protein